MFYSYILNAMNDLICPYSATLVQKINYACPHADEVIRRGGAEYVCLQADQFERCDEVYSKVKSAYLKSEGLEDDLLSLPHSVFVKIQFGCVLGLQTALARDVLQVDDIGGLIADAVEQYKNSNLLPFELLNETIASYKLQKRGKRN